MSAVPNNTTIPAGNKCGYSDLYLWIQDNATFFIFYIYTPIYFFIAFTGHILMLIGFIKRSKNESAYVYQVILTVSKTIEIFLFTLWAVWYKWWSGIEVPGALWYQKNHVLMWYAARASIAVFNSCVTTSLLLAVAMSADRLFGLWKPVVYRSVNNRRHGAIAAVICAVLGWSTSIFDWWRYNLEFRDPVYVATVNSAWTGSVTGKVLANLRNALRALGVLLLIVCNIAIVLRYRRYATSLPGTSDTAGIEAEQRRRAERKANEKALTTIAIAQSLCIAVSVAMYMVYHINVYALANWVLCPGVLYSCVINFVLESGDIISFVVVIAADRKIRVTILSAVTCSKKTAVVSVKFGSNVSKTGRTKMSMAAGTGS